MSKLKKTIIIVSIVIFIIAITILYSRFVATTGLKIDEYKIEDKIFKDEFHGLKIVHMSDVHYLTTVHEAELKNIVEKVNNLKPDIVVLTGDLLDDDYKLTNKRIEILKKYLSQIDCTMSKYAVSGNHDITHKEWEDIVTSSGFRNLGEDYDVIYNSNSDIIFIGGISSSIEDKKVKFEDKINKVLSGLDEVVNNNQDKNIYRILLMHEPDYVDEFDYTKFNLILSGHSHNGQVKLPFIRPIYLPKGCKKYYSRYYNLKGTKLYISSGIGTSGLRLRLFNRPSINFYRLTNK